MEVRDHFGTRHRLCGAPSHTSLCLLGGGGASAERTECRWVLPVALGLAAHITRTRVALCQKRFALVRWEVVT